MPKLKNVLDKTDLKILKILQTDGRVTKLQLAKEIDLSLAATLGRIKKLEKANYILSYHAHLNAHSLGLGIQAFIQIALARKVDNALNNFKEAIDKIDDIVECYQITGNFDYMLKVIVKDIPAFEDLISLKLSKIGEIGQMQTFMILSEAKNSKCLPFDYDLSQNSLHN